MRNYINITSPGSNNLKSYRICVHLNDAIWGTGYHIQYMIGVSMWARHSGIKLTTGQVIIAEAKLEQMKKLSLF